MATLSITPNSPEEPQETQNQQIYQALTNIQAYTGLTKTNNQIDYSQPSQNSNLTTSSTSYVQLPNFAFSLTPTNSLCDVRFSLTLQGTGYIALIIAGKIIREIPFLNGTSAQVLFANYETFNLTKTNVALNWRSTAGVLTLGCSNTTPFYNRFQVVSLNS